MDINNQTDQEIEKTAEKIEAIYAETVAKVKKLEDKQRKITDEFIRNVEKEKINKLKKTIQGGE